MIFMMISKHFAWSELQSSLWWIGNVDGDASQRLHLEGTEKMHPSNVEANRGSCFSTVGSSMAVFGECGSTRGRSAVHPLKMRLRVQ